MRKSRDIVCQFVLFLIWPFLSLLIGVFSFGKSYSKSLLTLVFSFIGYTCESEGDLSKYERKFYVFKSSSFSELIEAYSTLSKVDVYIDILSMLVGLFSASHHVFFAVLFGVFGYLLVSIVLWIYKRTPHKIHSYYIFVFLGFCLFYSIRSVISVRFYTGGLFFIYMMLKYMETQKMKYLYLSLLSPLFHFAHGATVLAGLCFFFLKKRIHLAMLIAVISFFVTQSAVTGLLKDNLSVVNSETLEMKYKAYASEDGQERMNKRYEMRNQNYNWKAKSLENIRSTLLFLIPIGLLLLYINKNMVTDFYLGRYLFVFTLILFALSNVMLNISNGDRYIYLYGFLALGLFHLFVSKFKGGSKFLFIVIGALGCVYGVMAIYASNPLFTSSFLFGNYFSVLIERTVECIIYK